MRVKFFYIIGMISIILVLLSMFFILNFNGAIIYDVPSFTDLTNYRFSEFSYLKFFGFLIFIFLFLFLFFILFLVDRGYIQRISYKHILNNKRKFLSFVSILFFISWFAAGTSVGTKFASKYYSFDDNVVIRNTPESKKNTIIEVSNLSYEDYNEMIEHREVVTVLLKKGCHFCHLAVPTLLKNISQTQKDETLFVDVDSSLGKKLIRKYDIAVAGTVLQQSSATKFKKYQLAYKDKNGNIKIDPKQLNLAVEDIIKVSRDLIAK